MQCEKCNEKCCWRIMNELDNCFWDYLNRVEDPVSDETICKLLDITKEELDTIVLKSLSKIRSIL